METKIFPILFKKTSTGAIQEWQVGVYDVDGIATIINNYGQVGGKIQESQEQVFEGKNSGKVNATTAMEQAFSQAQSRWEKQKKKGYVESIEDAQAGTVDDIIEGGVFPMLAHKFSEQGHKIKYPALAQPKLDGCVSDDTIISTNIGDLSIGDIVNNNIDCLVKSYNVKTKKTEYKNIVGRMKSEEDKTSIQWFEIETDDGRKLNVTGNHLVFLPKLKCWRRVDELVESDKILNVF